jgi:hypothetical protein
VKVIFRCQSAITLQSPHVPLDSADAEPTTRRDETRRGERGEEGREKRREKRREERREEKREEKSIQHDT